MNYYEKEGISQSFLKRWAISPAHAQVKQKTRSMDYGTLLHCAILQPEEIAKKYVIEPEELMAECSTRNVKKYKDWKAEQKKEVVKIEDWRDVEVSVAHFEQFKKCFTWDELETIIDNSAKEVELFCEYRGEILKGMADMIYVDDLLNIVYILDIKTTSKSNIAWVVSDLKYNWQLAYYEFIFSEMHPEKANYDFRHMLLFVESSEPFLWSFVEISEEKKDAGYVEIFSVLDRYIEEKNDEIMFFHPWKIII